MVAFGVAAHNLAEPVAAMAFAEFASGIVLGLKDRAFAGSWVPLFERCQLNFFKF